MEDPVSTSFYRSLANLGSPSVSKETEAKRQNLELAFRCMKGLGVA